MEKSANQSKNIALLEYSWDKGDEVSNYIAATMKEFLNKKLKPNESLEIEAKLGIVIPSKDIPMSDPFYTIWSIPNGLILPEQKLNYTSGSKTLYYFNPGVTKEKFELLIKIFAKECEKRAEQIPKDMDEGRIQRYKQEYMINDLGTQYTIDRMFDDGTR